MRTLKMYKLVSKDNEEELVEINQCRMPSRALPAWQDKYGDFPVEIASTEAGFTASISDDTIHERELDGEAVKQICAEMRTLIDTTDVPEALPTYADRHTHLLGAPITLESLVYLSESPEHVRQFLAK